MKEVVKTKKSVLGKGMAALLQSTTKTTLEQSKKPVSMTGMQMLSVEKITANKDQPRKTFDEAKLEELSLSIKENGIIQPIVVRIIGENEYQIIAGERRFRAAKKIGLREVPVVFKTTSEKETMVMAIIENVQRADLNCVEESLAYYNLLNEFKLTQEEVAKKVGKTRSSIANSLRLLTTPKEVLELLKSESLSFGHGKVLASVRDAKLCTIYAKEAVRNSLSVRELEALIKENKLEGKTTVVKTKKTFDAQLDRVRQNLETKTGFHLNLKRNNKGSGSLQIKFTNEEELNSIVEYFLK